MAEEIPKDLEEYRKQIERRAEDTETDSCNSVTDYGEPELDWAYGTLERLVRMVANGYEDFLMLDAKGGLGKSHNIKRVLREELDESDWDYQCGYTTPLELYKTLYRGRSNVIFLDDMSGITRNDKCVNMMKAATDTEGESNQVHWRSSRPPKDDFGNELDKMFTFDGEIIMSFNETPDNRHFNALKTRGQIYELSFTYDERVRLMREVAKDDSLPLNYEARVDTVDWIEAVTDASMEPSIRTLEKVLNNRAYSEEVDSSEDWQESALELLNLDYEKGLLLILRNDDTYKTVEEERDKWMELTGKSQGTYYNRRGELKESGRL
jgi:hypothetical protein